MKLQNRPRPARRLPALALGLLLAASGARATTIDSNTLLAVEAINASSAYLQGGFAGFSAAPASTGATTGTAPYAMTQSFTSLLDSGTSYTVTLNAQATGLTWGVYNQNGTFANGGSFDYAYLLSSYVYNIAYTYNAAPTASAFTISGLTAGATYTIQIWSEDTGGTETATWYDTTNGTGGSAVSLGSGIASQKITSGTVGTSDDEFSVTATVIASADGTLSFGVENSINNHPVLNGFTLSEAGAIPEPSTCALFAGAAALAGCVVLRRRRRCRQGIDFWRGPGN